mmetsp:Transcript_73121/g.237828  ORF Transcript_73121/g.237828 Transcript_73121/m.237828 type:complete len:372 (+) Transcript_73121:28-1143(+)
MRTSTKDRSPRLGSAARAAPAVFGLGLSACSTCHADGGGGDDLDGLRLSSRLLLALCLLVDIAEVGCKDLLHEPQELRKVNVLAATVVALIRVDGSVAEVLVGAQSLAPQHRQGVHVSVAQGQHRGDHRLEDPEFEHPGTQVGVVLEKASELVHLGRRKLSLPYRPPLFVQLFPLPQLADCVHESQEVIEIKIAVAILVGLADNLFQLGPQLRVRGHLGKDRLDEVDQLVVLDGVVFVVIETLKGLPHGQHLIRCVATIVPHLLLLLGEELPRELEESADVHAIGVLDFLDLGRLVEAHGPQSLGNSLQGDDGRERVATGCRGVRLEGMVDGLRPLVQANAVELAELREAEGAGVVDVDLRDEVLLLLERH